MFNPAKIIDEHRVVINEMSENALDMGIEVSDFRELRQSYELFLFREQLEDSAERFAIFVAAWARGFKEGNGVMMQSRAIDARNLREHMSNVLQRPAQRQGFWSRIFG